jgi:hypothetical protein
MTVDRSLSDRLLDLTVYAPIGFAAHVREQHEAYAAAGRERFGQTIELARFVGKVAVERGQQELRKRFDRASGDTTVPPTSSPPRTPAPAASPTTTPTSTAEAPIVAVVADHAPSSADLPLSDYDSLAASQVVVRLDDLQPGEVEAVRAYEAAHRARRTILGKIAQLQGS